MKRRISQITLTVLALSVLWNELAMADKQPATSDQETTQITWTTDDSPSADEHPVDRHRDSSNSDESITSVLQLAMKSASSATLKVSPNAAENDRGDPVSASFKSNALAADSLSCDFEEGCDCQDCNDIACSYDDACDCDTYSDTCCECEDTRWRLIQSQPLGIQISGWANGGYSTNDHNTPTHYNGPLTFNDREDGQLNQLYATMERAIDNGGCGWGIGGRVDVLYGTDHIFTQARGLEVRGDLSNRWNRSRFYGVSMPQAYMEVAYDRLRVQLGHFYRFVGYETVTAPNNFFYSHSYTAQYGEPFTHTGVLGTLEATDTLTLRAGWDRGWDNWEDDNQKLSILFGGTWDNGCGTTLAANGTTGTEGSRVSGVDGDRTLYSIVLTHEVSDRLTVAAQHDRGIQNNAISVGQDAEWYGVSGYLYYTLSCNWTLGARGEWFRDDDGYRVQGLRTGNPIQGAQFAGDFLATSLGLNYRGPGNLIVRSEIRYDWYDGAPNAGAGGTRPFDDGALNDQLTGGVDLTIEF